MKNVHVFTSMDKKYYDRIGSVMIESFLEKWPTHIHLMIYWEGIDEIPKILKEENRIEIVDLENVTNLNNFRKRNENRPGNTGTALEKGGNRFAPKGYSIIHQLLNPKNEFNIWLDADVETHTYIDDHFFNTVLDKDYITSYLGRTSYTETGFIVFNAEHTGMSTFKEIYRSMYDGDKLFELSLWHDCLVFDVSRINTTPHLNLSNGQGRSDGRSYNPKTAGPYSHVFNSSAITGEYMNHMKNTAKDKRKL